MLLLPAGSQCPISFKKKKKGEGGGGEEGGEGEESCWFGSLVFKQG